MDAYVDNRKSGKFTRKFSRDLWIRRRVVITKRVIIETYTGNEYFEELIANRKNRKPKKKREKLLIKKVDINEDRKLKWAKSTFYNHRLRGFDINVSIQDLYYLANECDDCPLCGEKLDWGYKKGKPNNHSPTLDRINNEKEIRLNNIEIVCGICNKAKNNRNKQEFIEYCRKIISLSTRQGKVDLG